jgi:hypothetical protein
MKVEGTIVPVKHQAMQQGIAGVAPALSAFV